MQQRGGIASGELSYGAGHVSPVIERLSNDRKKSGGPWIPMIMGVSIAGGVYCLFCVFVVLGIYALCEVAAIDSFASGLELTGTLVYWLLIGSFHGFVVGFASAALVCGCVCLPAAFLATLVTRLRADSLVTASLVGGSCGWLCWMPYYFSETYFVGTSSLEEQLLGGLTLLGPVSASLFGQIGAIAAACLGPSQVGDAPASSAGRARGFALRELLGVTTLASIYLVVLTGLERLELASIESSLTATFLWLIVQLSSMGGTCWLVRRCSRPARVPDEPTRSGP